MRLKVTYEKKKKRPLEIWGVTVSLAGLWPCLCLVYGHAYGWFCGLFVAGFCALNLDDFMACYMAILCPVLWTDLGPFLCFFHGLFVVCFMA